MSGYQLDPAQSQFSDALTQHIRQTFVDMLADQTSLPDSFKSWLPKYLETNPPLLPISQIFGFIGFNPRISSLGASVSTTSATAVALTGGPSLTGLAAGTYLVLWGHASTGIAGTTDAQSWAYGNGVASGILTTTSSSSSTSVMAADLFVLNQTSNTLEVRYRSSAAGFTSSFQFRFLIAIKSAN